jgi:hypothetical protein
MSRRKQYLRLGIVHDLGCTRGMVWLSREDLSPFDGSDGETNEVGQTGSTSPDALPLVDSVDQQDPQEVIPC